MDGNLATILFQIKLKEIILKMRQERCLNQIKMCEFFKF